jgi:probable rRNA maturation factor
MDNAANIALDIQVASEAPDVPTWTAFRRWTCETLKGLREQAELTIRIVDEAEITALNDVYRHTRKATNVLAFPADLPPGLELALLGDVVICAPVVAAEAKAQAKPPRAHWAHIVVHGILHLLDYDHESDAEAEVMMALETATLARLGYADPYTLGGGA